MNNKGIAVLEFILIVALLGGGLYVTKPALFPGQSKRAADSTAATKAVEQAFTHQGSLVAASVYKMNEAANLIEDVPLRSFMLQESQLAITRGPQPDLKELLEAEKRKMAALTGQYNELQRLHSEAQKKTVEAQKNLSVAKEERRQVDNELREAAAVAHAKSMQTYALMGIAFVLLAGWVYTRFMNITPSTLGKIRADIGAGMEPVMAMDTNLSPRFFKSINKAARQATPIGNE